LNNYKEATKKEQEEWQNGDRTWWSDRALSFVAIASVLQFFTLMFMGATMYLIQLGTG